jgi:hypothetical protein
MGKSVSVVDAIDKMRESLGSMGIGDYHYPWIANGPVESVLAFNNDEHIKLVVNPKEWHFSSEGTLTDLHHNQIPGSAVETTFPVREEDFPGTGLWPPIQKKPWNGPPVDNTNTTGNGYSKQAYFFNNRQDYFVTVGPSLPKIAKLKSGDAQFWVGSIGVITQGIGKFEGVHGMSVYIGSAYLPEWPDDPGKQLAILKTGFSARIGTYFKFVP